MIILGEINYLNLLPFRVFLKKQKGFISKKGYPSYINKLFIKQKVDAAFISSIKSKNKTCFDLGIVANKYVKSVLICEGNNLKDIESDTSNILASVLGLSGKVIIGDKALKQSKDCKDLAFEWYKRYKLPFVFARFCFKKSKKRYLQKVLKFKKEKQKIPYYILKQKSKELNLPISFIKDYLSLIKYELSYKEKKSLNKFLYLYSKTYPSKKEKI